MLQRPQHYPPQRLVLDPIAPREPVHFARAADLSRVGNVGNVVKGNVTQLRGAANPVAPVVADQLHEPAPSNRHNSPLWF